MKLGAIFIFTFLFVTFNNFSFAGDDSELDCEKMDHPAYQDDYRTCLKVRSAIKAKEGGVDCVACMFEQETPQSSGVLEALSVAIQPAAYVLSQYYQANYQYKSQKAWADAYASGYTQCTNRYNTYVNYLTSSGANQMTTAENTALSATCNSQSLGGYAGYGGYMSNGYGGFYNPYQYMGYSTGFMTGYGGPYANYYGGSIYNNGMLSGGMGISGTLLGSGTLTTSSTGITSAFGF